MPEDKPELPTRYCDLVMKGGVTSGVVYPLAAVKLSERFIFKNIGGTSAGAIAAAATAAAELARGREGFARLKGLPDFLGDTLPENGKSNLFMFFQPQPRTRRLFRMCVAGLGGGRLAWARVAWQILLCFFRAIFLGTVPGIAFLWVSWISTGGYFFLLCLIVALLLLVGGALIGAVLAIKSDLQKALPENFYGLCSGMADDFKDAKGAAPAKKGKPLTFWLTEYLNGFLDRDPATQPLTFGDLWGSGNPDGERNINLEMMTTCVTHGRPYRLPFRQDDVVRENNLFFFKPDDFRRLFPEAIVQWMCEHPRPLEEKGEAKQEESARTREYYLGKGFRPLPAPADLPVVVAVRMSLSFPILLSAIPLYAVDYSREPREGETERDLECCWFSDGGVCSNFPIHFFDAPLPRWPTFGINLVNRPDGTQVEDLRIPAMPKTNSAGIQEVWNRFEINERVDLATGQVLTSDKSGLDRICAFGWALIATMQNWSDSVQSRLPGYRDRIAGLGLTSEEGGLNLNMPRARITELTKRGEAAGVEFINRFYVPSAAPKMNWANHRWLRMRSYLASVEVMLKTMDRTCREPQSPDQGYEEWIKSVPVGGAPGYNWTPKQKDLGVRALKDLRKIAGSFGEGNSMTSDAPRPRPELRPRAQI